MKTDKITGYWRNKVTKKTYKIMGEALDQSLNNPEQIQIIFLNYDNREDFGWYCMNKTEFAKFFEPLKMEK